MSFAEEIETFVFNQIKFFFKKIARFFVSVCFFKVHNIEPILHWVDIVLT